MSLENAAPFFHFDFASFRSLENFRTRTQNQHNFIYLKQYRLAKGSTWRLRMRRRRQQKQGKRFDYSITLIWWDSEAMTTATKCEEKMDAAQLGKNQRGQALEAVKREIYFEQAL